MNKNTIKILLLIASFIVVCTAAWFIYPIFIFFGFLPIYLLNEHYDSQLVNKSNFKFFFAIYLSFLGWNLATTWWIINSTIVGATLAFTLNSLLMCIPVLMYRIVTQNIQKMGFDSRFHPLILVPFWVSFEYLHLNWDLTWPWLNLGNVFAFSHQIVQWYEFTGALGGTTWVLIINALLFILFQRKMDSVKLQVALFLIILIPIIISLLQYNLYEEKGEKVEFVVVQPNIDPYTQKFSGSEQFIPYNEQLQRLIYLSESKLTENTQFIVWPETSLPVGFDEDLIEDQKDIKICRNFIEKHPNLSLITGLDSYKIYSTEFDKSSTARYGEGVGWYDYFNTGMKLENNRRAVLYHKSKLVPGVEQMPYPQLFKWIEKYSIDMGGITGSLGTQTERTVFKNKNEIGCAPIICYESIFGAFVAEFVKNGANFITIITNDGWWGSTPGHVQHLAYARLRSIETRRSIARAANTGISGFINQKGDILINNLYGIQDSIRFSISKNNNPTIYVILGDFIGKIFFIASMGLILFAFILYIKLKIIK